MDQSCAFQRSIGADDRGNIKIQPNKDYNVYIGGRIYYATNSVGYGRSVDSVGPTILNVDFKIGGEIQEEVEEKIEE